MSRENQRYLMQWLCATATLLLMLAGCQSTPSRPQSIVQGDYEPLKQYLSGYIASEMRKQDVTGLSIALVDDQKVVWAQGFGYADKARHVAATPETLYRVGSISKLFTATAVMQLVEQGKLDIDKPLQTYVPEFSVQPRDSLASITPRNIMTHHSGLPRDYLAGMWTAKPESFTGLVSKLNSDSAAYPPDTVFSYSIVGVTLLGQAVQNVSGQPYAQYMQTAVLQPLGMDHSTFTATVPDEPLTSKGYRKGNPASEPGLRDVPAGGLNANVVDLGRFLSMTFTEGKIGDKVILKPASVREMLRPQNEAVALDLNFHVGLGWMLGGLGDISIENAGKVAHHSGATILFHSQMIALPEHKLGVVVLANSATAAQSVSKIAVEAIKLALQAKTGIPPEVPQKIVLDEKPIPAETVQAFAGDYTTMLGYAHIEPKGAGLRAHAAGATFKLDRRTDGQFGLRYVLLGFIPISMGEEMDRIGLSREQIAGREVVVAQVGKQQMLVGTKITPVPVPEKWQQRLGEYEVANLGGDELLIERFRLKQENGLLLCDVGISIQPGATLSLPIIPISDEKANVAAVLQDYGETVHVVTVNGEERLQFAGYELRKKHQ